MLIRTRKSLLSRSDEQVVFSPEPKSIAERPGASLPIACNLMFLFVALITIVVVSVYKSVGIHPWGLSDYQPSHKVFDQIVTMATSC